MRLGPQVVDLIRLKLFHDPAQAGGIGQIAIMQMQRAIALWFGVEMIEAFRIEGGRASNYAMYLITFREKQFGKIRPVLTRDADD